MKIDILPVWSLMVLSLAIMNSMCDAQQAELGPAPSIDNQLAHSPVGNLGFSRGKQTNHGAIKNDPTAPWIDTSSRASSRDSFLTMFAAPGSIKSEWVGNVTFGEAGSTSQVYRDAVLSRINWVRQMAGVPPVVLSDELNREAQEAAMMVSSNGLHNHGSLPSWINFTRGGVEALTHSQVCVTPYIDDPGCINTYVQEAGADNFNAGHRRWLLYPQTHIMGTGDIQPSKAQALTNALWVIDSSHLNEQRPLTRETFVAWPPKGFVPYQVVPVRWSFSYPGGDFTQATVRMQRNGGPVTVRLEPLEPLQKTYGENTLVWIPDDLDANCAATQQAPLADTSVSISISNVKIAGVATDFSYTVTIFDPAADFSATGHVTNNGRPMAGASVVLDGRLAVLTDSNGGYRFDSIPSGTHSVAPQISGSVFSPSERSFSAATSTADFNAQTCDYSAVGGNVSRSADASSGVFSFALAEGCPWVASSDAAWVILDPATLSGSGLVKVRFSITANAGPMRAATIRLSER